MNIANHPLQLLLALVKHHTACGGGDVGAGGVRGQYDLHHHVHGDERISLHVGLRLASNAELQLAPHAILSLRPRELGSAEEVEVDITHLLDRVIHDLPIKQ